MINAGVPCPAEIKRKLIQQKSLGRIKKDGQFENDSDLVNDSSNLQNNVNMTLNTNPEEKIELNQPQNVLNTSMPIE